MYKICFWVMFVLLISCKNISNEYDVNNIKQEIQQIVLNLDNIRWIEGSWSDTSTYAFANPSKHNIEQWKSFPDSMSGIAKIVKGEDTVIQDRLCIREVNNKLVFIVRTIGKSMISFPIIDKSSDGHICFANKAHNIQEIIYDRIGTDSLAITIKGMSGENIKGKKMYFKKFGF